MRMNPYRGPVPTKAQSMLLANSAKKFVRKLKEPTLPFTTIFKYAKLRSMQKRMAGPLKSDMNWPISIEYNHAERRLVFVLVPKQYFGDFRRIAIGRFKKPFSTHLTVGIVKKTKGPLIIHSISVPVERAEEIIRAEIRAKGGSKAKKKSVKMTAAPKSQPTRMKQVREILEGKKDSPKKKATPKKKTAPKKRSVAKKKVTKKKAPKKKTTAKKKATSKVASPPGLESYSKQLGPFNEWLQDQLHQAGLPAANPKDLMAYYQVYQMSPVQANPGGYHPSPAAYGGMSQNPPTVAPNPLLMSILMNPGMQDPMFEERFQAWVTAQGKKSSTGRGRGRRRNPQQVARNRYPVPAAPRTKPIPSAFGKKKKEISEKKFAEWLRKNGTQDQISRYESSVKAYMKFHQGAKPKTVVRYLENIGDPKDDNRIMEFEFSMGESPAEIYNPPKHSGKAPHSYIHDYETLPKVTSTAGGQRVTKRFQGTPTHVSDWIHA